ncbi:MAG: hypothetical protein KBB39_13710 [Phycicoccus sp.]|nr:hypothetical protein [Phycicoccus sp.]
MEWVAELAGAAALVVTVVAVLPQTLRIVRVKSTAGVSPMWAMLGAISAGAWVAYTAARGLWWATVADALSCLVYVAAVAVLGRNGVRPRYLAGALWLCVLALSFIVGGLSGLGAGLAFAFLVQVTPSIWTAYRTRDLMAASLTTWVLMLSEGALWGFYGLIKGDAAVIAFGLVAVLASLLMVLRLAWWSAARRSPELADQRA